MREVGLRKPGEVWSLSSDDDQAAPLVLPVLAAVIEQTEGQRTTLTAEEASWILRIQGAAPDLRPWRCFLLARFYIATLAQDHATAGLDALVAFAPWRSRADFDRYLEATSGAGAVQELQLPMWLLQLLVSDEFAPPEDLENVVNEGDVKLQRRTPPPAKARAEKEAKGGKTRKR